MDIDNNKLTKVGEITDSVEVASTELNGANDINKELSKRIIKIDPDGNVTVMVRISGCDDATPEKVISQEEPIPSTSKKRPKGLPWVCPLCKIKKVVSAFKTHATLANHLLKQHMVDDPDHTETEAVEKKPKYHCSICNENNIGNATFESKSRYQSHLVAEHHTYIFICEICSESFKLKANYKLHLQTHNVPVVKPYKCAVCNGRFVNRAGYEAHCRRFPGPHVKHTCNRCGVSFSKSSHILNHRCKHLLLEQAKERSKPTVKSDLTPRSIDKVTYNPVTVDLAGALSLDKIPPENDRETERVDGQMVRIEMAPHQQVYQVNVADWNAVAPYVIRDNVVNVTIQSSTSNYSHPD